MQTSQSSASSRQRVLIVDDDPDLLATMTQGLRLLGGFDVVVADQGIAGLETFFAERVDCMVVDLRMPGLNGYQLIRALRGDPSTADTPIVILSALAKEEVEIVGLLSGADAYLYKPVEIKVLIQTITQSIAITSEQRRARERAFLADKIPSDD